MSQVGHRQLTCSMRSVTEHEMDAPSICGKRWTAVLVVPPSVQEIAFAVK